MNYYLTEADLVCEDCGRRIREELTAAGKAPANPDDETTYDSMDFPKGPYPANYDAADCPQHCGMGEHCVNAFLGPGGLYLGIFLENPLTSEGLEYVEQACKDALAEDRESVALDIWAPFYGISLEEDPSLPMGE